MNYPDTTRSAILATALLIASFSAHAQDEAKQDAKNGIITVKDYLGKERTLFDGDGDGWDDLWCILHPDPKHRNKSIDTDGDKLTDYEEMIMWRDPFVEGPLPRELTPEEIAEAERDAAAALVIAQEAWERKKVEAAPLLRQLLPPGQSDPDAKIVEAEDGSAALRRDAAASKLLTAGKERALDDLARKHGVEKVYEDEDGKKLRLAGESLGPIFIQANDSVSAAGSHSSRFLPQARASACAPARKRTSRANPRSMPEVTWLGRWHHRLAGRCALGVALMGAWLPLVGLPASAEDVRPITPELRRSAALDPFYQKFTRVGELPLVGSAKVSDFALLEAGYIIGNMLAGRDDILQVLATRGVKIVVMAHNEYTTDLPEYSDLQPRVYQDSRARGLGGRTCSSAEENLLAFPGDPYAGEIILIHELAHVVQSIGMSALDATFRTRLRTTYQNAIQRGLWQNTYASSNASEYWAECAQDWFDNNRHDDALHNPVHTRAMLKEYDPEAAKLCAEVFGDKPWAYQPPAQRPAAERMHLAGFDAAKAPRFHWREVPIPDKPRVVIETAMGKIELELDAKAAPLTVRNFLHYVEERMYNNGRFFRTVTPANQPNDEVKIQVIQIEADPARTEELLAPIALERTSATGLRHLDGTLSMARSEPDTAQDSFSICIDEQPELDFGGKRNPDGQGFAAFGRVVNGMELVRKIQAEPATGQKLQAPVPIQRAVRLN